MTFIWVLLFGPILILSWMGWGEIFGRQRDLSQKILLGICVTVALGGWLNFFGFISSTSLRIMIILGLGLSFFSFKFKRINLTESLRDLKNTHPWNIGVGFSFLILLLINYIGSAAIHAFMVHDDLQSYLVFPLRALQTGTMEGDPFSVRRIESSLGGMSYLDSLFLSFGNLNQLNVLDLGVGTLIFLIFICEFAKKFELAKSKIFFLLFFTLLIPVPWHNLTALVFGELIFFSIFVHVNRDSLDSLPPIPLAFVVATGIILKSTFILPLFFLTLLLIILKAQKNTLKPLVLWTLTFGGCVLVLLLPWMLSLHRTAGTYFYPFLGEGFHASGYRHWPGLHSFYTFRQSFSEIAKIIFLPESLAAIFLATFLYFKNRKSLYVFLTMALIFSSIALGFVTGWTAVDRYNFVFLFPFVIFLLTQAFAIAQKKTHLLIPGAVMIVLLTIYHHPIEVRESAYFKSLEADTSDLNNIQIRMGANTTALSMNLVEEAKSLRALQESVPPNQPVFARLSSPFLMDFKRNPIFVSDFPGAASPLPGMPLFVGPEALSQYLLGQSIRYVFYSYKDEAHFTADFIQRLKNEKSAWMNLQLEGVADVQQNLMLLSKIRKVIYQDDKNFALDLAVAK